MQPIIDVKELTKIFSARGGKNICAVDHISFTLLPGETLGIVGESGSGKSTLAKLLMRLIEPTSGSIEVAGQDVTKLAGSQLRPLYGKIQMVFQTPAASFDPRWTLGRSISESMRNKGLGKAQAEERAKLLLAECGLPAAFLRKYPHEVSGGECQRAAIARALASEPQILILDEATASLDVTVQKQILDLLCQLRERAGLSYVFICHNLALVQSFCDKVLVMREGKIVERGTPNEVIFQPQHAYTKQLIEAVFI